MSAGVALANEAIGLAFNDSLSGVRSQIADRDNQDPLNRARRAVCDAYGSNPAIPIGVGAQLVIENACRDYWRRENLPEPIVQRDFTGGQCVGELYQVFVTYDREVISTGDKEGAPFTASGNVFGPVRGAFFREVSGSWQLRIACNGTPSAPTATSTQIGSFGSSVRRPIGKPRITNIVSLASIPGNCGNPTPEPIAAPDYPPFPIDTPNPTNIGGRPVNVTVSPSVDIENKPVLNVNLTQGGVNIYPEIQFSFDPQPPSGAAPPEVPASEGEPSDLPPGGGGGDTPVTPEEENEGVEVIGYRWSFPNVPEEKAFIPGTNPKVFPEIIGNLKIKYQGASGAEFWSDNVPIRTAQGSLIRPESSLKVKGFAIQSRSDYNAVRITPLRARKRASG